MSSNFGLAKGIPIPDEDYGKEAVNGCPGVAACATAQVASSIGIKPIEDRREERWRALVEEREMHLMDTVGFVDLLMTQNRDLVALVLKYQKRNSELLKERGR